MGAIPFALSVHHFISTVGADAGFAAIIGLAILILLFFSQARETATLRKRAAESDDHLHRLELYVDQLARSSGSAVPANTPAPAPPGVMAAGAGVGSPVPSRIVVPSPAPVPVGVGARAPGAPAGVGAPALNAATRLIPTADPIAIRSLMPAAGGQGAQARGGGAAVMAPPSPPPSTTAGGSNGSGLPRTPPPLAVGAGANQPPRVAQRPGGPSSRPPLSSSTARRNAASGGSRVSRVAVAVATVLVVVIAVAVLLLVTSGNSSPPATASRATQTTNAAKPSRHHAKAPVLAPASITVAVLNGTSTTNLAHDVMTKLVAAHYKQGTIATASDQTLTTTIVGYLPGHRSDAVIVAKSLKLAPASVAPVDPSNRAVACSATPTACPAQVIVTVGSDLASTA